MGCRAFEDANTSSVMILNHFFIMSSLNSALLVGWKPGWGQGAEWQGVEQR